MIVIPWCGQCATSWRGTPQQVVLTYSKYDVSRCPQCGTQLARNAAKKVR